MKTFRFLYLALILLFPVLPAAAQELTLGPEDLVLRQSLAGGYDLYIRQTGDIRSVLLTESTADPARQADSFALRAEKYNPVNGDEKRMLNGEFLDSASGLYSLIDSTPEEEPLLGPAFHIFIPYIVIYGYPWSRQGEIMVLDGTWLNIRTFSAPYGDYTGGFRDNPFELRVIQKPKESPPEEPDGRYMEDTVEVYRDIAEEGGGEAVFSQGEEDLTDNIRRLLAKDPGKSLDLVLCLDTTESMTNDMASLRKELVPLLEEVTRDYGVLRVGVIYYKDYMENFLTKTVPFQAGLGGIQRSLDSIRPFGGRDIPEAVYEALYAAVHEFSWQAEKRMVILVGDAPPHPRPRGTVTREMVYADAEALGIELNTIILPQ